jgi:hypothetical protein
VTLAQGASGAQPGGSVCVLAGTGTGECRRVVAAQAAPLPPPPPPAPAPPGPPVAPIAAGSAAVLVPCSAKTALKFARLPSGSHSSELRPLDHTTSATDSDQLAVCVLCDPPGHGSSSTSCGENPYFEPVVFDMPDSWTAEYGTMNFTFSAVEEEEDSPQAGGVGHIKLSKGHGLKCLGAATTKPAADEPLGQHC